MIQLNNIIKSYPMGKRDLKVLKWKDIQHAIVGGFKQPSII